MTTFVQLHLLTSYPPACLNRDDNNRPKTAKMGGIDRLRISSQSLKRAWRVSDVFREKLSGQTGIRSKELGRRIKEALMAGVQLSELLKQNPPATKPDGLVTEEHATEWAWTIAAEFVDKKSKGADDEADGDDEPEEGKTKKKGKKTAKSNISKETLKSEQVVFYSRDEIDELDKLVTELRKSKTKAPTKEQLAAVKKKDASRTADLAMFGRMLASSPDYNVEAACQVAHAVTVHRAAVEDDYFSAVDDLNRREENVGFAFGGEQGFGAGLFYLYVCIDRDLLKENLGGDAALAEKAIKALVEAAAMVAPTGKQNSFASRASAFYVLAEKGARQPRALSLAFMKPVRDGDMLKDAVSELETMRANLDKVYYGGKPLDSAHINALAGDGDFQKLLAFVAS